MNLSVAIITYNEETNIARTLRSVIDVADEIVIVDSGSTDLTMEIAQEFGPKIKIFAEAWKGFAAQKNSAIEKCGGQWVLSLDADEELSDGLRSEIAQLILQEHVTVVPDDTPGIGEPCTVFSMARRNMFLGRWMRHGGFWPDRKIRLFQRGAAQFEERPVHESIHVSGPVGELQFPLHHHSYPTLVGYIEHSLQLRFARRLPRRTRRPPPAPLSRGLRELEILQGLGDGTRAEVTTIISPSTLPNRPTSLILEGFPLTTACIAHEALAESG